MSPPSVPLPAVAHVGSRVWSADLADHVGDRVVLGGWLHHRRALKSVLFLVLRDAFGTAQVVVEAPADRVIVESL
ncbi:MAG: hypothetical protein AVDCRST_MAG33-2459, partial [uncultured Thermomicrobiales bacterium]